ncbi:hypothetical protein BCR36DRAFT_414389 [Piromyces finnis]|uniref:Dickkopf N-terminal cysteine-rich domain-containing protein n=1 Tax=Piromyces finnis TaxID=1754191 RepID=A0A1Y1V3Q4_9FUNG|nr:hypothetical protein BCR36DRAFT_414389 [Piromyces finnis]|eukprot:ORX45790.1 hypothetical protein BCR36DRAFT_414389 [Piromyces finnis]
MDFDFMGLYSFDSIKASLDSYEKECKVDSDCPDYFKCFESKNCVLPFYCSMDGIRCSYNTVARNYCSNENCNLEFCQPNERNLCLPKNLNDTSECLEDIDCLSQNCIKFSKKCGYMQFKYCIAGAKNTRCGLDIGSQCYNNEECLSGYCEKNVCEASLNVGIFTYIFIGCVIVLALLIFSFFIYILRKIFGRKKEQYDYYDNNF